MSRTLCALLVAAFLPFSAHAGEHRDAVMELLNGIEQPATQADLEAIGDGALAELREIAADESVPTSRRGRAISALQHYPTDEVRELLAETVKSGDKSLYRRKAVGALGAAFGADAVATISPYLTDKDEQLRIAVARTLGNVGGDDARAALEARVKKEKTEAVAEAIDAALKEAK